VGDLDIVGDAKHAVDAGDRVPGGDPLEMSTDLSVEGHPAVEDGGGDRAARHVLVGV
jgi:hypothetical protein